MDHGKGITNDLLDATISRNIVKVRELVRAGIDPCTPTSDGTSPIHKAALIESPVGPNIVAAMLSFGADPNKKTSNGLSALHIAAMWGRVATIDVLLDYGADVALKDNDDMSALDYAELAEECRYECIDALTRYRAANKDDTDSGCEINNSYYLDKDNDIYRKECDIDEAFNIYVAASRVYYGRQMAVEYDSSETKSDHIFTDISDISDSDDDVASIASSNDSFWSVSSVPYIGGISRNSTFSKQRNINRSLDMELAIEAGVKLNPKFIPHDEVVVMICDVQESYRSKITCFNKICDVAQRLLSAVALLDIPVLVTENAVNDQDSTAKEIDISQSKVFQRTSFSGVNAEMKNCLIDLNIDKKVSHVILFGLETHTCVQQTALDLISQGYSVHVVADATFSRLHDDRMFAFERIRQSGGFVTTFESILYLLLTDHEHPKFFQLISKYYYQNNL